MKHNHQAQGNVASHEGPLQRLRLMRMLALPQEVEQARPESQGSLGCGRGQPRQWFGASEACPMRSNGRMISVREAGDRESRI
jgi:hypothetical protein